MRLLSTRLVQLQRAPTASKLCATQIRHASRYSAPVKRSYTAAPTQDAYFVNPSGEDADLKHPTHRPRNPLDARAVYEAGEEKEVAQVAGAERITWSVSNVPLVPNVDRQREERIEVPFERLADSTAVSCGWS